ncbi:MAG: hypothetical protein ACLPN6_09030 [Streptosporangiaceae bacterium]
MITTALAGAAGSTFILKAGAGPYRLIPAAMASLGRRDQRLVVPHKDDQLAV